MAPDKSKAKRGRPRKSFARTPEALDEIIFKVANTVKQVETPQGEVVTGTMFELAVLNTSSRTAGVRLGAKEFVGLVQRAAERERRRARANTSRNTDHSGML